MNLQSAVVGLPKRGFFELLRRKRLAKKFSGGRGRPWPIWADRNLNDYSGLLSVGLRRQIADLIEEHGKIRVLDIGCGEAKALSDIKEAFPGKVEVHGLSTVRYPHNLARGEYHIGHAENLRFPNESFHLVLSVEGGIAYTPNQRRALQEVRRVLLPGGKAFFTIQEYRPLKRRFLLRALGPGQQVSREVSHSTITGEAIEFEKQKARVRTPFLRRPD